MEQHDLLNGGTVSGLQWSDGNNSGATVTVQGLNGRWAFNWSGYAPNPYDAMYDSYLYCSGCSATITLHSLTAWLSAVRKVQRGQGTAG